jgi:hypothetical protein
MRRWWPLDVLVGACPASIALKRVFGLDSVVHGTHD